MDAEPGKFRVGKTSTNCNSKGGHIVLVSQSANHWEDRALPGGKVGCARIVPIKSSLGHAARVLSGGKSSSANVLLVLP